MTVCAMQEVTFSCGDMRHAFVLKRTKIAVETDWYWTIEFHPNAAPFASEFRDNLGRPKAQPSWMPTFKAPTVEKAIELMNAIAPQLEKAHNAHRDLCDSRRELNDIINEGIRGLK